MVLRTIAHTRTGMIKRELSTPAIIQLFLPGEDLRGVTSGEGAGSWRLKMGSAGASSSLSYSTGDWHSWQNHCRALTLAPHWEQKARSNSGSKRFAPQEWQNFASLRLGVWQ